MVAINKSSNRIFLLSDVRDGRRHLAPVGANRSRSHAERANMGDGLNMF